MMLSVSVQAQRKAPEGNYKEINKRAQEQFENFAVQACNSNTTICQTGVAGPFNFETSVPNFHKGCQIGEEGAFKFAFILLNISTNGPLNLLVQGDGGSGYLDVLIFRIPPGEIPCNAIVDQSNMLSCNYAANEGGCVQFGNSFPCNSPVIAPNVTAGSQLMIVVQDYSDRNTSFTMQLGPGAQTAPPDATIDPVAPVCSNNGPVTLVAGTNGGIWSGNGVLPEGIFNPEIAGAGIHTISYSVGVAPCDATSSTTITVLEAPTATFTADSSAICTAQELRFSGIPVTSATYQWTGPDGWTSSLLSPIRNNVTSAMSGDYTFTVSLPNGCSESQTQAVLFDYGTTVITQNIQATLNNAGIATITPAEINNGSANSCGIASLTLDRDSFTCANVGLQTVTLTVTDNNGNTTTGTATVNVVDDSVPTAVAQNLNVVLDASGSATITAAQIDNGSSDNCGIATMTIDETEFTCDEVGNNTVTLTVTDSSGNRATTTAVVSVTENLFPIAIAQDINVDIDDTGQVSITAEQIDNGSSDNCGIASITVEPSTFNCADIGTNTVTLKVTDNSGNISTETATVTINPIPAPTTTQTNQEFCRSDNPTIADIIVNENNVAFFSTINSTAPFPTDNPIYNGTYYAAFKFGDCVGADRLPITISVTDAPPPTGPTSQEFCVELNPTIASLTTDQTAVQWYDVANGGTALPTTTPLEDNGFYYASQTANGCESSTRLEVEVILNECDIFVHNALTPNGDGRNDILTIRNIEKHSDNHLQVFNRYGSLVFETRNYGVDANSTFRGIANKSPNVAVGTQLLPHGTYLYIFNYQGLDGNAKSKSGYIHLTY